jgi:hypothetical protein
MATPTSDINDNLIQEKQIYKVNYLVNNKIIKIFVFNGKKSKTEDENELFKKIFNESEIAKITNNKIDVKFVDQYIHLDDTIGVIKLKILSELERITSIEQIYLFCQKMETLNPVNIYQSLTQNNKLELTKVRLDQFLSNIVSFKGKKGVKIKIPEEKDIYDYEDILSLKLDQQKCVVNRPLGQKFFIVENEYPYIINPYLNNKYDNFIERNATKTLSTLNSHLLLNSGPIIDNNIYLCLADDILKFVSEKDLSQETTCKIYFPFLYNKNIDNLDSLNESKIELIDGNQKVLTDKVKETFKTINMFYDVYSERKNQLNYVRNGIKFIKAEINPEYKIKIPLEIIFKIIHATENNPLIKYNPSTRQENIYRLYTDKIATDGRKIPYLKKATIFKLMRTIGRTKSVSVFIENTSNNFAHNLICEFEENGTISVTSEFNKIVSVDTINKLFRDSINPIIQELKNTLEQSGYKIKLFDNLSDENVTIKQLTYESQIRIKNPINLEAYKGCVSAIFNNESSAYKQGIHLRFKRVSNFNKVTSQEAFIIEKIEDRFTSEEIVDSLLENFPNDINKEQAIELIRKVVNELQVERGVKRTEIKIKDNPGFKTTIQLDPQTAIISIVVENINDISYLQTIPVYLDTTIRLTQDKNSTNYPVSQINKLCSSGEKEDIKVLDIISPSESELASQEIPSIETEEELEYKKLSDSLPSDDGEKVKNLLDLFYNESDIEELEDLESEYEGGKATSSSEKSESSIESETESDKSLSSLSSIQSEVESPTMESPTMESPSVESEKSLSSLKEDKSLSSLKEDSEIVTPENESKRETLSDIKESPKLESPTDEGPKLESPIDEGPKLESPTDEGPKLESPIDEGPKLESPTDEGPKLESPIDEGPKLESPAEEEPKLESPAEEEPKLESPTEEGPKLESPTEGGPKLESPTDEGPKLESPTEEGPKLESPAEDSIPILSPILTPEEVIEKKIESKKPKLLIEDQDETSESEEESESEPEPEPESESDVEIESEVEPEEEVEEVRNIDGVRLKKPYYFQTLIEEKDPVLIIKEDTPEYNSYSRTCSSDTRRQPIILTDEELKKIQQDQKMFLRDEDVIRYGSNPKKQFNYVCPRYWCLKTNKPIKPSELKEVTVNGKKELMSPTCGMVLPKDAKEIKPGYYVYEFYEPKKGDTDYRRYPGFQTDKHPQGYCLPCCFDKYLTEGRITAKNRCLGKPVEDSQKKKKKNK